MILRKQEGTMNNNNLYNTNNFIGTLHQDYFKTASNALATQITTTSNALAIQITTTSNVLENHLLTTSNVLENHLSITSNILQFNSSNFTNRVAGSRRWILLC